MRVKTIFATEICEQSDIKDIDECNWKRGSSPYYDDMYCPYVKYISNQMLVYKSGIAISLCWIL